MTMMTDGRTIHGGRVDAHSRSASHFYAAPLVAFDQQGNAHPIPLLNFTEERDQLFDSLTEAQRALEVRVEAATADRLRTLVTLGCRALHYSGHGDPNCLAFENGQGAMHGLTADELKRLFAAGTTQGVQLVFVSACHSRQAGEAFVSAGVPHVVAVRLEEPVYDIAALPIYRAIQDRLGEANCRQGLGNLLVAEGQLQEAAAEMLAAFAIHQNIHNVLGCGASLGYLGRITLAAENHTIAVLFFEEALIVFRTIHDSFGQALTLRGQGQALAALELSLGALAALWQAREIFHAIQDSSAAALDELFARLERENPENYPQLIADLRTRAEELRQEAVAKVRETAADDPLIQQISAAVRELLAQEEEHSART